MNTAQNQIKRTLSASENISYVRRLLESNAVRHRSELAVRVCEGLKLHDVRGRPQLAGCSKALRELERAGHFTLAASRQTKQRTSRPRVAQPVAQPTAIPAEVGELQKLELIRVRHPDELRIWNEMMLSEHPRGAGPLAGRQMRYLIGSAHGWLGGFGFAAPALQLGPHDAWIGWDGEQRRDYLHYVVNMNRFLIRSSVHCHNLASKILSQALAVLAQDFEQVYGYRPWLVESFVDTAHFTGSCYRAANWIQIGHPQGRGRQDRFNQKALNPKAIYVYPLVSDFRARMGLSGNAGGGALKLSEGLDGEEKKNFIWIEHFRGRVALASQIPIHN